MPTITASCHFFNEINALGGWLESASQWADHILLVNCGPGGELSSDGSIELCEKWGVDLRFSSIDDGFGVVRTSLIGMCPTEWVWIGDADERIYRFAPRLKCIGTDRYTGIGYPDFVDLDLGVQVVGVYDQIEVLRSLMLPQYDAIVTSRRHWQTFHIDRPSQSWHIEPDWQARILRCSQHIGYRAEIRMHEQLCDFRTNATPNWYQPTVENVEVFFEHFHLPFKRMEHEQRQHDIQIYDSIHAGNKPPTLAEFRAK